MLPIASRMKIINYKGNLSKWRFPGCEYFDIKAGGEDLWQDILRKISGESCDFCIVKVITELPWEET